MRSVRIQCVAKILARYGLCGRCSSLLKFACHLPQNTACANALLDRWEILPIDQFPRSEDIDFDCPNRSHQVERQRHVQQKKNFGSHNADRERVPPFVASPPFLCQSAYSFRERCLQAAPLTAGSPRIAGAPRDTMNRVRILIVMFTTSRNSKLRKAKKTFLKHALAISAVPT